ncbi:MAG TPA: hypothetical protein VJB89_00115 [Candidatus Nanoarchaeia archaeon]|nr:hypothetical protein [Candidatus Nanoarchaeia archaeon]
MRILLFFGLIVLFSSFGAAEEIFSQTVFENYNEEVDGEELVVLISGNSVSVRYGLIGGVFTEGECDEQDNIKICVSGIDGFSATVTIDKKIGTLSISKKIITEPVKGKNLEIEVILTNTGEAAINNIYYEDIVNNLIVSNIDYCQFNNGKIIWNGNLNINSEHKCSYSVKSDIAGNFKILGLATYNGQEIKSDLSFEIPDDIDLNMIVDSELVFVGDTFRVDLILKSETGLTLNNLDIIIPTGLRVINTNLENIDEKYGLFEKITLNDQSKEYFIELVADSEGKYNINAKGIYSKGDFSKSVDVEVAGVEFSFSTKIDGDKVSLLVKNPFNEKIEDLKVTSISVLKELNKEYNVVVDAKDIEYVFKDITITNAVATMTYSLTVKYNSSKKEGSQQLKLQFNRDIGGATIIQNISSENFTETINEIQIEQKNSYKWIIIVIAFILLIILFVIIKRISLRKYMG